MIMLRLLYCMSLVLLYGIALPLVKVADFINNTLRFPNVAKLLYRFVYGIVVASQNILRPFVSDETRQKFDIEKVNLKHGLRLD